MDNKAFSDGKYRPVFYFLHLYFGINFGCTLVGVCRAGGGGG
jgi:hypothetical protein